MSPLRRLRLRPAALAALLAALPPAASAAAPAEGEAGPRDSLALSYTVVPYVFFAPETRWGGGAAGGAFKRLHAGARPSSLVAQALYTQKHQYQAGLHAEHHAAGDRGSGWLDLAFKEFPDRYFGIGEAAADSLEEGYTARSIQAAGQWMKSLGRGFKAGGMALAQRQEMVATEAGGALARGAAPGAGDWIGAGIGPQAAWDTRDNVFFPRSGWWVELGNVWYAWLDGGGPAFRQVKLDVRHYRGLGPGGNHVVAAQAELDLMSGGAPFSVLPSLGGSNLLRGYYQGRHRDRSLAALQAEYRFPLWRRLGGAAFAASGAVAPDPASLAGAPMLAGGGAGLRWRLNSEGVHLRADLAWNREREASFYVTFMEAF